ncbi:hypothetical protein Mal4_15570 [Maioricimonas rarisocia]|uniref:Uncharacterized protein n=1 Tax=Maioricimonas rarisocia TaxID=2528026 RepID=A0A517Z494_9PLAN|nr:hypothetical protein [Maioricimonas rarisocia]QDU37247.1 hypothetical protein Mal4_15570 [Maioricimonas rarisocia]
MNLWPPVLAADIGGLIAIAFLAISFIGWLVNLINGQNHPPPPQRRGQRAAPPRPRDERIRNEIEVFLKQAAGERGERGDRGRAAANDIEMVEPPRERRRPPARPAPRRRPPAQQPAESSSRERQDRPKPKRKELRERHLESRVSLAHPEVIPVEVPHVSDDEAARDARSAEWSRQFDLVPEQQNAALRAIMESLRDPGAIQRAMVVNEILLPPLSRRHR